MLDPTTRALIHAEAKTLWSTLGTDDRNVIRFGMTPLHCVTTMQERLSLNRTNHDESREITLALFACAKTDGGMVV